MVGEGVRFDDRGLGRTGCLIWILVLVILGFVGVETGSVYIKYWQLRDEMQTQAQFAPNLTDQTIRRRVLRKVEELGLPESARSITIRRTERPPEIRIFTSYQDTLQFPFFQKILELTPEVRAPL